MLDLVIIVVCNLVCFWIGARWGYHRALMKMLDALARNPKLLDRVIEEHREILANDEPKNTKLNARLVKIEQVGSQYYVFAEDNEEFLGQAHSREAALDLAKKRSPEIMLLDRADTTMHVNH